MKRVRDLEAEDGGMDVVVKLELGSIEEGRLIQVCT
jgi:hypothetical protein